MASFFGNVIDYIFGETDTLDSKNIIIDNVKRNNYSSIAAKFTIPSLRMIPL